MAAPPLSENELRFLRALLLRKVRFILLIASRRTGSLTRRLGRLFLYNERRWDKGRAAVSSFWKDRPQRFPFR